MEYQMKVNLPLKRNQILSEALFSYYNIALCMCHVQIKHLLQVKAILCKFHKDTYIKILKTYNIINNMIQ